MSQTEKKQLDPQWEDKIHDYITPGHFDMLNTIEDKIQSCNDVLEEAGIGGISYRPQKSEIETYMENVAVLNRFINGLRADLDELIDQPLYESFNQNATENLSRIHMSDFKTANTVGLTMETTLYDETGMSTTITQLKDGLSFEDFLGSSNRACIEGFAKLYKEDYELYKEIYGLDSLTEYLELLMAEGEFDHRKNQPVKSFFSGLVGIIPFVKPVYELATGKEIITGEDLSDFEQGMNGVSLALDCFVVGKAVSALSDLAKPTLGQIIKLGGRTLAVDALTYGASYGTTAVLEDTHLPNEIKLLLSLGVGLSVSYVSGKYLIKSADGNVISEVDEKTFKGAGGPADGEGAFNGDVTDGGGFGKLAEKEINVSQKGLDKVKNHIKNNGFEAPENSAMIERIEKAMMNGEKLTGADASYYMHELKESTLMSQGLSYDAAHIAALETYKVSPFSVYHPEVILKDPSAWGKPWFEFWEITK